MITMIDIYNNIKKSFFKNTKIDIQNGSTIDSFLLASSEMIYEAYREIENNKTPHIYSKLSGKNLDDIAILCGITRKPNESDKNFLYRILKWNTSNKASNLDAIETALMDMDFCSHVTYMPLAYGCGTSAAYIIPKNMSDEYKEMAIQETKDKLSRVVSPSSYIEYIIPEILQVRLVILYKSQLGDMNSIKKEVNDRIIAYINSIAPGDYLEIGILNKIGIEEAMLNYFNVTSIFINNIEIGDVSILQKIESKFILSNQNYIEWMEVE